MKLLFLFIILNLFQSGLQVKRKTNRRHSNEEGRVVGGTKVKNIREFPFVGAVVQLEGHITVFLCGSAIISDYWALTAAHCLDLQLFVNAFKNGKVYVRGNSTQWRYYVADDHRVINKFGHYLNRKKMFHYDVALLKVREPFQHRSEISVAPATFEYKTGLSARVLGWGTDIKNTKEGPRNDLYYVDVTIRNWGTCKTYQRGMLTSSMFCAGNDRKDACNYDTGGPMYYYNETSKRRFVIGLVSFGRGGKCGTKLYTGVYANLAKASEWIWKKISEDRGKKRALDLEPC